MIKYLLSLLLITSLHADDSQPGGFLSIAGLQHGRAQIDFAVPMVRVSSSSSGLHVGFGYGQNQDIETSKPVGYSREFSYRGYQVGYFADLGRGYFTLGYERTTVVTQHVLPGEIFSRVSNMEKTTHGAYGKFGIRGKYLGIYTGYGTASKLAVGLSVHF